MAQSSVTDKIMLGVWFALLLFYFQESPLKKQPRKAVFFQTQRKMALSLTFIKGLDKTNYILMMFHLIFMTFVQVSIPQQIWDFTKLNLT